jgi:hypothetical protein
MSADTVGKVRHDLNTSDAILELQLTIVLLDHHLQGTFELQSLQIAKLRLCSGSLPSSVNRIGLGVRVRKSVVQYNRGCGARGSWKERASQ